MPYFTSAAVITEPSSKCWSGLRVYVQVVPPSDGTPGPVARSGTNSAPASPGAAAYVTSVRV